MLETADVRTVKTADLPGTVDLSWAASPCQDLSLAGGGAGLKGDRSGTFWPFWSLMTDMIAEGRAPRIIALENVCGTLTSHGGKDFAAICSMFQSADSNEFGALVIDAFTVCAALTRTSVHHRGGTHRRRDSDRPKRNRAVAGLAHARPGGSV